MNKFEENNKFKHFSYEIITILFVNILFAIISSTISAASSSHEASPQATSPFLNIFSTINDKMNSIHPGYILIGAIELYLFSATFRYYISNDSNQTSFGKYLSYLYKKTIITLIGLISIGIAHVFIGNILPSHEIKFIILTIAVVSPLEHFLHFILKLPHKVRLFLADAVPRALDAKQIIVTGTLHSKSIRDMLEIIDSHELFEGKPNGVTIFLFDAKTDDYAEICRHFLKFTNKIESMSDIELDKALPLFEEETGKVMEWITDVNDAKLSRPDIHIHRIQVLTGERHDFLKAIEKLIVSSDDKKSIKVIKNYSRLPSRRSEKVNKAIHSFITAAKKGLLNFNASYCCAKDIKFSILVKESLEIGGEYKYKTGKPSEKHKSLPRGEFIMFDRKYLVRFNTEAKLLEVVIGDFVEEFARSFDSTYLLSFSTDKSFTNTELYLKPMYEAVL